MGKLLAIEGIAFKTEIPLAEKTTMDRKLGVEIGVELQLEPPKESTDCPTGAYYYSSPLHPNKEYRVCSSGYTYWTLALSTGALKGEGSSPNDLNATIGLSLNWTRAEKKFKPSYNLDGSDSPSYHPISFGLGPVGQYSLMEGWKAGLGANIKIADFVYINGGVIFDKDGAPSQYLAVGLRNFL